MCRSARTQNVVLAVKTSAAASTPVYFSITGAAAAAVVASSRFRTAAQTFPPWTRSRLQALGPWPPPAKGGAIVMTASTASAMGEERQVIYNTSKGAVAALARSLGVALARYGIRVNAVAPGYVLTDATRDSLSRTQHWSNARSRIALDRPGTPAEIGAVIAFLLSDDAAYMTGSVVVVDGGHTAGWRNTDWAAVPVDDPAPRAPSQP